MAEIKEEPTNVIDKFLTKKAGPMMRERKKNWKTF
jgi:hypothetical protein